MVLEKALAGGRGLPQSDVRPEEAFGVPDAQVLAVLRRRHVVEGVQVDVARDHVVGVELVAGASGVAEALTKCLRSLGVGAGRKKSHPGRIGSEIFMTRPGLTRVKMTGQTYFI